MALDKDVWLIIQHEYENTDIKIHSLAKKYNIPATTIQSRYQKYNWKKNDKSLGNMKYMREMARNTLLKKDTLSDDDIIESTKSNTSDSKEIDLYDRILTNKIMLANQFKIQAKINILLAQPALDESEAKAIYYITEAAKNSIVITKMLQSGMLDNK